MGPHYEANSNIKHAAKLEGRLLLLVGEMDTNVPPESTYRVADALLKAADAGHQYVDRFHAHRLAATPWATRRERLHPDRKLEQEPCP